MSPMTVSVIGFIDPFKSKSDDHYTLGQPFFSSPPNEEWTNLCLGYHYFCHINGLTNFHYVLSIFIFLTWACITVASLTC